MRIENGVDIIENNRFDEDILSNTTFLKKYFTETEIKYCYSQYNPKQHLAARFAGKEAVLKALSQFGVKVKLNDLEVSMDESGVPRILIVNRNVNVSNLSIKLSIAHCDEISIANAIIYSE